MWPVYIVLLLTFMFSPNLIAYARHGTGDLLLAAGFTMDDWVQHLEDLANHPAAAVDDALHVPAA